MNGPLERGAGEGPEGARRRGGAREASEDPCPGGEHGALAAQGEGPELEAAGDV